MQAAASIDGKTKVYALLGSPVSHSLSPLLHNTAYREMGFNGVYTAFRVEEGAVKEALEAVKALDIKGVNLTHPLKESSLPYLDGVEDSARQVGAVNTVLNREGKLQGYNTDVYGFAWSLQNEAGWQDTGSPVLLVGAGGACRAVAISLAQAGVRQMAVLNRTRERARELLSSLNREFGVEGEVYPLEKDAFASCLREASLVVNTLPMDPFNSQGEPLYGEAELPGGLVVYDLRYSPWIPFFLRWAGENGARVFNGAGMLVGQACRAMEIFTGTHPSEELLYRMVKNS